MLLVTTALEETWGQNEELLFLGGWCRIYSKKKQWKDRKFTELKDPWSDRSKRYKAYEYTKNLYFKTLIKLTKELNSLHEENKSVRYWEIICGPWLKLFINSVYHKWESINQACISYSNLETITISFDNNQFIPADMIDYENHAISDVWNHHISSLIIKKFHNNIKEKNLNNKNIIIRLNQLFGQASKKRKILSYLFDGFNRIIHKSNFIFISNPYLNRINEIKLGLSFGNMPTLICSDFFKQTYELNLNFRCKRLSTNYVSDFENFLSEILLSNVPYMYVEGYRDLLGVVKKKKWPRKPKAIITAIDHVSNDIFKAYTAENIELGTNFNIICHGGGGKFKYSDAQDMDFNVCDNYFTWGWSEYSNKCVRGFYIKNPGFVRNLNKSGKYLFHITYSQFRYPKFIDSSPTYEQFIEGYIYDQSVFINGLSNEIKNHTYIKLHYDLENSIQDRLSESCFGIKYIQMGANFYRLLKGAKLVISTYNCTTPVESIAMNIPTIIFWNPEHWELTPSAIPIFDKLKACGIFHSTPESAALKVNAVWNDVNLWWESEEIQSACNEFRDWFGRSSNKPIEKLRSFCYM